jgi:hypothetical protein
VPLILLISSTRFCSHLCRVECVGSIAYTKLMRGCLVGTGLHPCPRLSCDLSLLNFSPAVPARPPSVGDAWFFVLKLEITYIDLSQEKNFCSWEGLSAFFYTKIREKYILRLIIEGKIYLVFWSKDPITLLKMGEQPAVLKITVSFHTLGILHYGYLKKRGSCSCMISHAYF